MKLKTHSLVFVWVAWQCICYQIYPICFRFKLHIQFLHQNKLLERNLINYISLCTMIKIFNKRFCSYWKVYLSLLTFKLISMMAATFLEKSLKWYFIIKNQSLFRQNFASNIKSIRSRYLSSITPYFIGKPMVSKNYDKVIAFVPNLWWRLNTESPFLHFGILTSYLL